MKLTRRDLLKLGAGAGAYLAAGSKPLHGGATPAQDGEIVTKPIPSSGEHIPVIGIGTRDYNTGSLETTQLQFRETMAA